MEGPVNRISIDKTGTKVAVAYGCEVLVVDQNTLCESPTDFLGTGGSDLFLSQLRGPILGGCLNLLRFLASTNSFPFQWPVRSTS